MRHLGHAGDGANPHRGRPSTSRHGEASVRRRELRWSTPVCSILGTFRIGAVSSQRDLPRARKRPTVPGHRVWSLESGRCGPLQLSCSRTRPGRARASDGGRLSPTGPAVAQSITSNTHMAGTAHLYQALRAQSDPAGLNPPTSERVHRPPSLLRCGTGSRPRRRRRYTRSSARRISSSSRWGTLFLQSCKPPRADARPVGSAPWRPFFIPPSICKDTPAGMAASGNNPGTGEGSKDRVDMRRHEDGDAPRIPASIETGFTRGTTELLPGQASHQRGFGLASNGSGASPDMRPARRGTIPPPVPHHRDHRHPPRCFLAFA